MPLQALIAQPTEIMDIVLPIGRLEIGRLVLPNSNSTWHISAIFWVLEIAEGTAENSWAISSPLLR